ncbi:unnamed protein product [Meganyctiphanes norvegica]|uniref:Uncharacterized protein n=1 Tax=Meganyctiphanes norvegica TaxID=48144 RepID=A0AAV2PHK0_MEGNR
MIQYMLTFDTNRSNLAKLWTIRIIPISISTGIFAKSNIIISNNIDKTLISIKFYEKKIKIISNLKAHKSYNKGRNNVYITDCLTLSRLGTSENLKVLLALWAS